MWRGYEYALCIYGIKICTEWINRNYKDNQLAWFSAKVDDLSAKGHALVFPHWFNDFNFHLAHRSNLLRKNPDYYGKFNWNVPSDLPYIWPSEKE